MRKLILLTLLFATPALAERAPTVEVAMVTDVAGQVERQPDRQPDWSPLSLDDAIRLYDALRTWARSAAELSFVDGTIVLLGEKTRLRISTALFDASRAPEPVRLALAEGTAEVYAGRLPVLIDAGGTQRRVEPGDAVKVSVGDEAAPALEIGVPSGLSTGALEAAPPQIEGAIDAAIDTGAHLSGDATRAVGAVLDGLPGALPVDGERVVDGVLVLAGFDRPWLPPDLGLGRGLVDWLTPVLISPDAALLGRTGVSVHIRVRGEAR
ncbi:MAG: hypothetical protein KC620_24900 [Myxococcales bacterium]|nr:hypothetical protein [Myxococcales bacterium]